MKSPPRQPLTYAAAGVDIDRADHLISKVKSIAADTTTHGVLGGIGGFGALFEVPIDRYRQPVLVSGTDGVGTKLRLAIDTGIHHGVGQDLVAMCVNDIVVLGAEPLYFLDYYATGRLDVEVAEAIIRGIAHGCKLAGAALIGGETAELPGMYHGDDYDLAGFCVGVVEKQRIVDGKQVCEGDVLLGIASSGPHANGYSLIREVIARGAHDLEQSFGNRTLVETLLEPTRIYVSCIHALLAEVPVNAMAHITGGGILENLPRVLPSGACAHVEPAGWPRPAIFDWIQQHGHIEDREMYRTFNCGIGMVVCIPRSHAAQAMRVLQQTGEEVFEIGVVKPGDHAGESIRISGCPGDSLPPPG